MAVRTTSPPVTGECRRHKFPVGGRQAHETSLLHHRRLPVGVGTSPAPLLRHVRGFLGGGMKPKPEELLVIYRRVLAKYEAEGDTERAEIQRRLIARKEAEL